ncbi:MAG: nuclear transport factor 2 family protein [Acidobacteriales bacterium]|nr:nuclear transport factor 2 family protein [Terriglobales bacterium]
MFKITAAAMVLVVVALSLAASEGAPTSAATHSSLLRAREKLWRAWFVNDKATLQRILPVDTIGINAAEKDWTNLNATLASSAKFVADGGRLLRLEFPRVEIRRHGDVYVIYSEYLFETETKGQRSLQAGRATEIFLQHNGEWINPGWHMDSGK